MGRLTPLHAEEKEPASADPPDSGHSTSLADRTESPLRRERLKRLILLSRGYAGLLGCYAAINQKVEKVEGKSGKSGTSLAQMGTRIGGGC